MQAPKESVEAAPVSQQRSSLFCYESQLCGGHVHGLFRQYMVSVPCLGVLQSLSQPEALSCRDIKPITYTQPFGVQENERMRWFPPTLHFCVTEQ